MRPPYNRILLMPDYQLTIITPVFNGAAYIERCLRNVLDQNAVGVEHLVMDGASTDGTREIVERFALAHPHVRLVSERDAGQSDAMNKGIKIAAAPVISFLNTDDSYTPGTLRRVLALLPTLPEPGFLCGNCQTLDAAGNVVAVNKPSLLRLDDILVGPPQVPFPVNPCAYFYHRRLHDLVGPYDAREEYAMDLEFLLRALPVANVRYVDETWGNFPVVPGTKTHDDYADGMGERRVDTLLRATLAKLPPSRRLPIQLRRLPKTLGKVRKLPGLATYYFRHPAKFVWRMKYMLHPAAAMARAGKPTGGQGHG